MALEKLKDPIIKSEMCHEINAQIQTVISNIGEEPTESWTKITDIVTNIMQNRLGYEKRNKNG